MELAIEGNVFGLNESLMPTLETMVERFDDEAITRGTRHRRLRRAGDPRLSEASDCRDQWTAVGIGATMSLAMDVRLASEQARIGFVFGRLDIVPEACSSSFLFLRMNDRPRSESEDNLANVVF